LGKGGGMCRVISDQWNSEIGRLGAKPEEFAPKSSLDSPGEPGVWRKSLILKYQLSTIDSQLGFQGQ